VEKSNIEISQVSREQWGQFGTDAHLVCFGEHFEAKSNRIDYALVTHEGSTPLSYVTIRELDEWSAYMQYGGSFPSAKGTPKSYQSFELFLATLSKRYRRVSMLVENTNAAMLKFGMRAGFLIVGIRNFKGSILLEHLKEWED
jgi:hypothetical protein